MKLKLLFRKNKSIENTSPDPIVKIGDVFSDNKTNSYYRVCKFNGFYILINIFYYSCVSSAFIPISKECRLSYLFDDYEKLTKAYDDTSTIDGGIMTRLFQC